MSQLTCAEHQCPSDWLINWLVCVEHCIWQSYPVNFSHLSVSTVSSLKNAVRLAIGPIATPDFIVYSDLPKTRSGKIMRRILRKIASGEEDSIGDTSTLADPSVRLRGHDSFIYDSFVRSEDGGSHSENYPKYYTSSIFITTTSLELHIHSYVQSLSYYDCSPCL